MSSERFPRRGDSFFTSNTVHAKVVIKTIIWRHCAMAFDAAAISPAFIAATFSLKLCATCRLMRDFEYLGWQRLHLT
jgi:hypothetical protein